MYSNGSRDSGIYYQIDHGTHLSVEWMLYNSANQLCHWVMVYSTDSVGSVSYYYFSNGDLGSNSTIGVQGIDSSGRKYLLSRLKDGQRSKMLTFGKIRSGYRLVLFLLGHYLDSTP
jgi:hypothetical protein